ncbi:MAG: ABC transporter substrate-binding protein, partial [Elusimicrobiota bacterium]
LLQFDPDGNLEPGLAVSWKQINPLTMRFLLRPGVRFHNGEEFNAEAVRYTLERHLDPETQFPGYGFLATIKSVKVIDPLTVDLETHVPDSLLLRRLAGFVFMLPPQANENAQFETQPVGTGPYIFKNWAKGDHILLERNPGYWNFRASSPEAVEFRFIPAAKQVELLLAGQLDMVTELPGTFTLAVASNPRTKIIKKKSFYTVAGNFNTGRGALKDVRVRRAINHAVNKQDLIRYDVLGNGIPIASLSMPGEIGHNPHLKAYEYDPDKARVLLKEAGVGFPLKLRTFTKVQGARVAGVLKENLKKVGIQLDIYKVTTDAENIKHMASKNMDLGISGFPDIMGHIFFPQSILFYSKSPFSLHSDPQYDKRLEDMVAELDPAKHEKLAQELDAYVHDQALAIFTYQQIRTYGVATSLNFTPAVTSRLYCNRIKVEKP